MPVKFTKALEAVKQTTLLTTYVTGALVSPASGHLSAYVDLVVEDQHREVEVNNRLTELISRAREEDYRRPSSGVGYWYMPLNGAKASIAFTITSTDVVEGMVAIGINGTIRGGGRGSILLDSCWNQQIAWASEQDRLTV